MGWMVWTGLLLTAAPPLRAEAPSLPVAQLTLFPNNHAWIQQKGEVSIDAGTVRIALDPNMIPGSFRAQIATGKITSTQLDPTGPYPHPNGGPWSLRSLAGKRVRLFSFEGAVEGIVTAVEPANESTFTSERLALRTNSGLTLFDQTSIQGLEYPHQPVATLVLDSEDGASTELQTSALVAGIGWTPQYQLDLGPEGDGKFRLEAAILSTLHEVLESPATACALTTPRAMAAPATVSQSSFAVGPVKLTPGSTLLRTLLEQEVHFQRLYEWKVAAPALSPTSVPEDEVKELLILENLSETMLPEAEVFVTIAGEFVGSATFPATPSGQRAEIVLGRSADAEVSREEVELERKHIPSEADLPARDWVSMTGSLTIRNSANAPIAMRVIKEIEGDGTAVSDEGRIERVTNRVGAKHPLGKISWEIEIAAGGTKRLTYGYQIWVDQSSPEEPLE